MGSRPQERRARVKGTAAGRGFGTHPPTQFFLFPQNVNRVFPIQVWGIEAKGKGEDLGLQLLGRLRNWGISFSKVWDLVVRIVKIRIIAKSAQGGHQRSAPLGSRNCGRIQVLLDELADPSKFSSLDPDLAHPSLFYVMHSLLLLSITSKREGKVGGMESPVLFSPFLLICSKNVISGHFP